MQHPIKTPFIMTRLLSQASIYFSFFPGATQIHLSDSASNSGAEKCFQGIPSILLMEVLDHMSQL